MSDVDLVMEGLAERLQLSRAEVKVLDGIAAGRTNGEIGRDLLCAEQTVKFHISNIFRKIGVRNRVEAARWFWERRPLAVPDEFVFAGAIYRRVEAAEVTR